jgi:hypothetical protein
VETEKKWLFQSTVERQPVTIETKLICERCGARRIALTPGFNEDAHQSQALCGECESELGEHFKKAVCDRSTGSRICIVSEGRPHIHTSQGPLYAESVSTRRSE